jgi:lipid-A-disaccharide synthase
MTLRVGLVAGEPSGDLLASRVIGGLHTLVPDARCEGIGGPAMVEAGFDAWHPMHALTVFGYVDAFKRLPSLLGIYNDVRRRWLRNAPDVFVGVDAPDFNLRLEEKLKAAGIPTLHFVGPSIWAWRYERIERIRRAVSHMLVLFPFEVEIYEKEGIPVTCVGHPLAANIPLQPDRLAARRRLGLDPDARVLAILPGSRSSELKQLAPRFLQAAQLLRQRDPALQFVVPMVNAERRREFDAMLAAHPLPNCHVVDGAGLAGMTPDWPAAWHVMEAADAVLVASGTATLETALFKRPMVISYVVTPLMRRVMQWKSGQVRPYVPWVGLPNVLARDFVAPELLQEAATPQALADASWRALMDQDYAATVERRYTDMHHSLALDTPRLVAEAIAAQVRHAA